MIFRFVPRGTPIDSSRHMVYAETGTTPFWPMSVPQKVGFVLKTPSFFTGISYCALLMYIDSVSIYRAQL